MRQLTPKHSRWLNSTTGFGVNRPFNKGIFLYNTELLRSSGGTGPNSCNRSCKSEPKMYIDWLKHSLSLENHNQEKIFWAMQKQTSAPPKHEVNFKSLEWVPRASCLHPWRGWWLIEGLCPWHHSLRVKNCATQAKHTSALVIFYLKKNKKWKNLTRPIEVLQMFTSSECIDHSGSEYLFFFFAKWEVALVEKAQV